MYRAGDEPRLYKPLANDTQELSELLQFILEAFR
jgi:hypothetical protein